MPVALHQPAPRQSGWKGKGRELSPRDEGNGGQDGYVIDLQLVTDSPYQASYVAPILVGSGSSRFYVQVDTGSSDLWVTSTACGSSLCKQAGSRYDSSQSSTFQATNQDITLSYAEGGVSGPIVWDTVSIGGYSIANQAFAAASDVSNEPLSSQFSGVIGLAPPANSLIGNQIPQATTDVPDGATVSSNLFSITPASTAPGHRFFSLSLERPESDRTPSRLGIGRHPSDVISDPSKIEYDGIISASFKGPLWWQAGLSAITVIVDGVLKPIDLPASVTNADGGKQNVILDSGVPIIITTQQIANAIYGALGIGPASDGNFYLSCTTPINITIQLDDRTSIPLHPLDLSAYPSSGTTSDDCIGLIQTPSTIPGFSLTQADMILGVPFLRNTYTVMAYDPPNADGSFPANGDNADRPRLGLLGLTDPATAADEFYQVRVLKQPLGTAKTNTSPTSSKGLSVGIEVLIGLLGFFGLLFVIFGARWAYMKRKYARARAAGGFGADGKDAYALGGLGRLGFGPAYGPARKSGSDDGTPSEDELRQRRFEEYRRTNMTDDTALTRVESASTAVVARGNVKADEFGALMKHPDTPGTPVKHGFFEPWAWDDTLVDDETRRDSQLMLSPPPKAASRRTSNYSTYSAHARTFSGGPAPDSPLLSPPVGHGHGRTASSGSGSYQSSQSRRSPSVSVYNAVPSSPLAALVPTTRESADIGDFALSPGPGPEDGERPQSMAGVGTARGRERFSSLSMPASPLPLPTPTLTPTGEDAPPVLPPRSPLRNVHQLPPEGGPAPAPAQPVASSTTNNDSRVSVTGHEPAS